jgi:phage terminase small subunit
MARSSGSDVELKHFNFAMAYIELGDIYSAAIKAGYKHSYARTHAGELLKRPNVIKVIEKHKNKMSKIALASFEDKIELLWKKALEVDDAKDMVALVAELNQMQGHYAPQKTMNMNINAKIVQDFDDINQQYEDYKKEF